jgi:hypothetical protein
MNRIAQLLNQLMEHERAALFIAALYLVAFGAAIYFGVMEDPYKN